MTWRDDEDDVTEVLRGALHREAEQVRPGPDGLRRIQARVAEQAPAPGRWRRALPSLASAAAVIAVAVGGVALLRPSPGPVAAQVGSDVYLSPKAAPIVEPLPVYFAEKQGGRWALVREFVATTQTDPAVRLQTAVRLAVSGRAVDPEYTSVWRSLKLSGEVGVSGGAVPEVSLGKGLVGRGSTGEDDAALARLAIQQLVWTVTATTQQSVPVRVQAEDGAKLFGQVALGGTFERTTGAKDPRAPIWISSLSEAQPLSTGTATITGDALVQGGLTWQLDRVDASGAPGEAVDRGGIVPTQSSGQQAQTGQRGQWSITVRLPSRGSYRLSVLAFDDALGAQSRSLNKDGSQSPVWTDTKTFTVR